MRKLVMLTAVLAVAASACTGTGSGDSDYRVVALSGTVEHTDGDGEWEEVDEEADLAVGTRVRTGERGRAVVRLPDDRSVELGPGTELSVTDPDAVLLGSGGSALASAPGSITMSLGDVGVRGVAGMFRVDRGYQDVVKVYEGSVRLPGSGWDGTIPALRQAVLISGSLSRAPRPANVNPDDRWDASLFGDAITIGDHLDRLEGGLKRQLPGTPTPDVVARAIPRKVPAKVVTSRLQRRPKGRWAEVAVASVVAMRTADEEPVHGVLDSVLDLRELGASWIIVAAEWQLTDGVLAAVGKITTSLARVLAALAQEQAAAAAGGGTGAIGGGGTSTTSSPGDSPGDPGPPDEPDPPPPPPPDPDPECGADDVVCQVGETIGDVDTGVDLDTP